MKKLVSVILSAMMVFAVATMSVVPALADVNSPAPGPVISGQVNSQTSGQVTWTVDTANKRVTFTYNGSRTLLGWTFPGLTAGTDYTVVSSNSSNSATASLKNLFMPITAYAAEAAVNPITIQLTDSGMTKSFAGNAIVDDDSSESTKKDDSGKSPTTGATVAFVALTGTGVAVLAALKKKRD